MKLSRALLAALVIAGLEPALAQDLQVSRGEYVARLGNCVACHSVAGGEPFAGGLKMRVPMLGVIYTTNITPDPDTGIGSFTFEEFDKAVRLGIARDGHPLYPAMPYPSYAKTSEEDMRALFDFFMDEVAPVRQENQPPEFDGWRAWRWPLRFWNLLFRDEDRYEVDDDQSEEWNRGAYLVQGLGHCGACHTPRGWFFQEKGLTERDKDYLSGAPLDYWSARSLNGDVNSGLGRWSLEETAQFLKTGHNAYGSAVGTMVEVINNSTYHMTDEDINAMAVYLKSLPAVRERNAEAYSYDDSTTDMLADLSFESPGAQVYYTYCSACHAMNGRAFAPHPPLAGNGALLDPDPSSLINLVLNGSLTVLAGQSPDVYKMPYFRILLSDQQVADVVSFIRNAWGNAGSTVTAEQVAEIRAETDPTVNDVVILRMK